MRANPFLLVPSKRHHSRKISIPNTTTEAYATLGYNSHSKLFPAETVAFTVRKKVCEIGSMWK